MKNNLLVRTRNSESTYGMYLSIADPIMVELVAYAGFDFIRIDCEHMLFDGSMIANLIRTANAVDLPVMVRINSLDDITRILDYGASGFVIPDIKTKEQAIETVNLIKYAPLGQRGMMPHGRCIRYGEDSFKDYMKEANDLICLTVQIESKEGLDNIDEILSVEGIDMVTVGKLDLSQSLGITGQNTHPDIIAAENFVIQKAFEYNKFPSMMVSNVNRVREAEQMGVRCMTICYDSDFILKAFKNYVSQYKTVK